MSQIPELLLSPLTGLEWEAAGAAPVLSSGRAGGTARPAFSLVLAALRSRVPSFIQSYFKAEFSPGRSARALLSAERKGLRSGVLQKEGKCSWREGGEMEKLWEVGREIED